MHYEVGHITLDKSNLTIYLLGLKQTLLSILAMRFVRVWIETYLILHLRNFLKNLSNQNKLK